LQGLAASPTEIAGRKNNTTEAYSTGGFRSSLAFFIDNTLNLSFVTVIADTAKVAKTGLFFKLA